MTEEIKEIIEKINKEIKKHIEDGYSEDMLVIYELDVIQWRILLNYITNLQKELEKKDAYIKYLEEYNPKYYKGKIFYGDGREDYKSRNEKALFYIDMDKNISTNWNNLSNEEKDKFVLSLLNELENILKGGNE